MRVLILALVLTLPAVTAEAPAAQAPAEDPTSPFPPGEGAALTRQICTRCHGANLILSKHFDATSAQRYWRIMVGTEPTSEDARTVIRYLSTVLGQDDDGPDSGLR